MYIIVILSEQGVPYLHATPFSDCGASFDAARELSRDYPLSIVRVFSLGEKTAIALFEEGKCLYA